MYLLLLRFGMHDEDDILTIVRDSNKVMIVLWLFWCTCSPKLVQYISSYNFIPLCRLPFAIFVV